MQPFVTGAAFDGRIGAVESVGRKTGSGPAVSGLMATNREYKKFVMHNIDLCSPASVVNKRLNRTSK